MRASQADAFLDPVGAGSADRAAPPQRAAPRRFPAFAAAPVLAMLAALALVAAGGISQRSGLPAQLDRWFYGFFLDRYPLFAFALVYGIARLAAAAEPGPASVPRRAVFCLAGVVVLCIAGLYPTFGGLVLRGGFSIGGMAFLAHLPLWLAFGIGAAVSAGVFGGILGTFTVAANRSLRPSLRRIVHWALGFLALWFGAVVLGLAQDLGLGPWPRRALRPDEAVIAGLLLLAAALPHTVLAGLHRHRSAD